MTAEDLSRLHAALDVLEGREAELLVWGDTEGAFTDADILSLFAHHFPDENGKILMQDLQDAAMLFSIPNTKGTRLYRTRMAESVHLFRHQRQWFRGQQLSRTRTLVADYRFIRRPRSYPERKYPAEKVLSQLSDVEWMNDIKRQALRALIGDFSIAGFQSRATARILRAWDFHSNHTRVKEATATIVCAGTGSGKTLAFYLPALTSLINDLQRDRSARVRTLALYPRKELLKDQFMETWGKCREVDAQSVKLSGRKIRIGSFFGDTPHSIQYIDKDKDIPFDLLRCNTPKCQGGMRWKAEDISRGKEILRCTHCAHSVGEDEVVLTRVSLMNNPPDILFTTTEMLNQHLGNNKANHLFGVGINVIAPPMVLLDEVHTYSGNSGAQTAYLLRRWMQLARCRPHFVGLSATLSDAERFFADLVGANKKHVMLIEPTFQEMEDKGAEYLLALRGDPVSQTALLSTTIQTSMLARRLMDTRKATSHGTWGRKTFVFTDDLDINNRLYHQLCDAEGWRTRGKQLVPNETPLAAQRNERNGVSNALTLAGQNWRIAIDIGHPLDNSDRAIVARTSSQDTGVDPKAEVVVATASLEVGFNDPSVGVVIQHKAPRNVASYLQRKGRAGRSRTMRPWMIVVLSEFGRDRVVYQRYEELVTPEIKGQSLPLGNIHIQKMQAAMATLDWLSMKIPGSNIWSLLNKPPKNREQHGHLEQMLNLISVVLEQNVWQQGLEQYLFYALKITESQLQHIMWSPPRSIMMELLPTLKRQLTTKWSLMGIPGADRTPGRSPLPLFIPAALFSELNLPELSIQLERPFTKYEYLPFIQGLKEFAPGRISKRYAIYSDLEADWLVPHNFVPLLNQVSEVDFEINEAFGDTWLPECLITFADAPAMKVIRPLQVLTRALDFKQNLTEKSNSQLKWHTHFATNAQAETMAIPAGPWSTVLQSATFYTHQHMTPLELTRYTTAASASLRSKSKQQAWVNFRWVENGQPVAVGARQWVDGLKLSFTLPSTLHQQVMNDAKLASSLRTLYFHHRISSEARFEHDSFTADWIYECYLAALTKEIVSHNTVADAIHALRTPDGRESLATIADSLFQAENIFENDDDGNGIAERQELQQQLRSLFNEPQLLAMLDTHSAVFTEDLSQSDSFCQWLQTLLINTFSGAVKQTGHLLLPDVDDRGLLVDAVFDGEHLDIWLTESEPGGCGIITRLEEAFHSDPVALLNLFIRSFAASDYEQIDDDLFELLSRLPSSTTLQNALNDLRMAESHHDRRTANGQLRAQLKKQGFALSHSFMSVLHTRILRPGSHPSHDRRLLEYLREWQALEAKAGYEVSLNIFAHTQATQELPDANVTKIFDRFCQIQGMLWQRGSPLRQSVLSYYNPFDNGPKLTERLLLSTLFQQQATQVDVTHSDWLQQIHIAISREGFAELLIPREARYQIVQIVSTLQLEPIDYFGLHLYPRMGAVDYRGGNIVLRIELAEALQ
ncbi:TPA: DEAD/DEAH box helicase [Klebsiella quasipneumoniae]|nr:DEAD/DEAH box helicase [Klebsiella quasipneumoniae]HDG7755699.1 DEAD/DEAH box helicase [Klebsiella quasipneumoniae]